MVILLYVNLLLYLLNVFSSNIAGLLEAISNLQGVYPLIEQFLRLLQQSPRQDHHPRRPVPDLVVLRLRQLHQKPRCLVLHLYISLVL